MKKIVLIIFALFALSSASAWAQEDRVYRVAVEDAYPPFSIPNEETKVQEGFDVDIATAVCNDLKIKCEIVTLPFEDIIPAVESGKVDVGCAGLAVTEERLKKVLFTNKYFRSSSLLLENPGTFKDGVSPETLKGKKIAVQGNTTQETYVRKTYGEYAEVVTMGKFEYAIDALHRGEVDLAFIDGLPGYHYLKSDKGLELEILGDPVKLGNGSCMVVTKGLEPLRDKINGAIDAIRQSGEYDKINRKYFEFNVY